MSCAQVAGMSTAGLVAMRSSCPRNPGGSSSGNANNSSSNSNNNKSGKNNNNESYGAEVTKPGPHDVLLGRGGGTNNHSGNINFRKLVNEHKMRYLACSKIEKPNVAREVVDLWKKLDPPGRFLVRKEDATAAGKGSAAKTNANGEEQVVWVEVPEKKAREKASQCLRERTPDVVPYIRQLREQQDQMTEQGVSMVQQQLQMQREAEAQKNSLHGMAGYAQPRRNSLAEQNPYQTGNMNPMAAMSAGDYQDRRGSMPMMQTGGNGMMNPMQQQFSRRISAPHLSSGNPHAIPNNATAMMGQMTGMAMNGPAQMMNGQMGAMNPQFGLSAAHGMMEPGFCGSDGGMYDPAFASSMTALQLQQHHQQQMQLQQLQQQQQMLQHQMAMQQQHMAAVNMQAQMSMQRNMMGGQMMDPQQQQQWNMQQQAMNMTMQGGMPHGMQQQQQQHRQGGNQQLENSHHKKDTSSRRGKTSRQPDAPPKSSPSPDVIEPIPLPKPDKSTSAPEVLVVSNKKMARDVSPRRQQANHQDLDQASTSSASQDDHYRHHKKQPPKTALKVDKAPQVARRNPQVSAPIDPPEGNDEDDIPLPLNAHGGDDEVGIEEYRKTLESYMVNNNISQQTPVYYSDEEEEDLSVESFPEWPDNSNNKKRMGRAAPELRGVDRHKSGQSMMSCTTAKSNATSLSGLSMLSDMMSMESGKSLNSGVNSSTEREEKMGATKRFSSTASIMSELTEISHTIDGLGLDDDI